MKRLSITVFIIAAIFFLVNGTFAAEEKGTLIITKNEEMVDILKNMDTRLDLMAQILLRSRVLAVQAANGIYTVEDRGLLDEEFQNLMDEFVRIRQDSSYYGIILFNNKDINWKERIKYTLGKTDFYYRLNYFPGLIIGLKSWKKEDRDSILNVKTPLRSSGAIGILDELLMIVSQERAKIGAAIKRINYNIRLNELLSKDPF
jgi:flagellin